MWSLILIFRPVKPALGLVSITVRGVTMYGEVLKFGAWLDTPAGGDWSVALWGVAAGLVLVMRGARRG